MVNRGKNFPSIIMWSLGNEIYAADNARGPETAQKLYDWAKEIDDTRPCTMGEDKFRERDATDTTSTYIQVANKMDVVGMNYVDRYPYKYDTLRATHPDGSFTMLKAPPQPRAAVFMRTRTARESEIRAASGLPAVLL